MIELISDTSARIELSSFFYQQIHLEKAAKDFEDICNTEITQKLALFIVSITLKESTEDILHVSREFCNYLLGLRKNG
ncbi:MAG: HxsD-like protein [Nanoarchaeota archaeon]|nr:HxsD-like protein [Nanoarchaeota archaeon]MBU1704459.1 HxsD-like protein [Nanoarchaeota archaeon]